MEFNRGIRPYFLAIFGIFSIASSVSPASARQPRSFSSCVAELASYRYISTEDAIAECKNRFTSVSANEHYSVCVSNLSSIRHISTNAALGTCKEVFWGKAFTEDYADCVSRLARIRHISIGSARSNCEVLLQNAARPSHDVVAPGDVYAPHSERVRPESKLAVRKCFNVALNQIWDDVHCQAHVGRSYNSPFEWRTFYLD